MGKKIISLALALALFSSFWTGANAMDKEINTGADILNWGIFSETQYKGSGGKRLQCGKDTKISSIVKLNVTDPEKYEQKMENLKTPGASEYDPGLAQDVKGCLLQKKADQYLTWLIYLAILALAGFMAWKASIGFMEGDKGSDEGSFDRPDGGGSSGVMKDIKPALVTMGILFFIVIGGLNTVLVGLAWIYDAVFG